jgi:hypothetical protein
MTEKAEQDEKVVSQQSENEPYSGSYSSPDGKYSFSAYVGDDGIAYGTSKGYENEESALGTRAIFIEIHSFLKKPFPLCLDISALEELTPEARKVWSNTALSKDSPLLPVALHGGGFFIRSLMNFYARIARMPVRLFKTKEEAVAWLKENNP